MPRLRSVQASFYFNIDANDIAKYREILEVAQAAFSEQVQTLPIWTDTLSRPDGYEHRPYHLNYDGIRIEYEGNWHVPLSIDAQREIPPEHIIAFRAIAQQVMQEAGKKVGLPVSYSHAQVHQEWVLTESTIFAQ